jgi:hypothetical protein
MPANTDVQEGDFLLKMTPSTAGYLARIGTNSYEEVEVAVYAHTPTSEELRRYLSWQTNFQTEPWHKLPSVGFDLPCREGDSPLRCPGQIARQIIVAGQVVYELVAMHVSEFEVRRFFASFRIG